MIGLSLVLVGTFLCSYFSFVEQSNLYFISYSLSFLGLILCNKREWSIREVLLISLLISLFFLGKEPTLSDDAYRYLAEAKAMLNGINPYIVSPLNYSFSDSITSSVNHAEYTAIYPPLFQLLMTTVVSINYSMFFLQLVCILVFLSIVFICYKLKFKNIINVAWNPFFIIEACWHCHLEIFIGFFLMISLLCIEFKREKLSSLFYGVAIALKFVPLILIPLYFIKLKKKIHILISFIPLFLSFLFYKNNLKDIFTSLLLYMGNWEFASPLYKAQAYLGVSKDIIKIDLLFLYFLITFLIMFLFYKSKLTFFQSIASQYFLYPFFSAVLYPWYLLPGVLLISSFQKKSLAYFTLFLYSYFSYFSYTNIPEYIRTSKWQEPSLVLGINVFILILMLTHFILIYQNKQITEELPYKKDKKKA